MYNFTVLHKNDPVANVYISDDHKQVKIEKLVPDSVIQPFGGNNLSLDRVYTFLKSRCYEDDREDLDEILRQANMTSNNPWEWNKVTHGVMWDDQLWIKFEGEDLCWEDVRWRK